MKLDLTKPHGTIHGALDNKRYEQGGRFFDADGDEVVQQDPIAVDFSQPRKRTKAEEEQYQKDVAEAAAILAAKGPPADKK